MATQSKHYANKGTGLRSLLDTYVYVLQKGSHLDWSYIGKEAQKLGIAEFERNNRDLAMHLFSGESLVCYTFMKQTEYGNGEFPSDERSISVFLRDKAGERAPCLRREASPLGHECTFDG